MKLAKTVCDMCTEEELCVVVSSKVKSELKLCDTCIKFLFKQMIERKDLCQKITCENTSEEVGSISIKIEDLKYAKELSEECVDSGCESPAKLLLDLINKYLKETK